MEYTYQSSVITLTYIINTVWAAVYRYVGEVFSRNPLHSIVQSVVDGKRQRLETFRNKLVDARRRGFHFEQVQSGYVPRRQIYERSEENCRQTDSFSSLYSRRLAMYLLYRAGVNKC